VGNNKIELSVDNFNHPLKVLAMIFSIFKIIYRFRPEVIISHTHYANIIVQPIARMMKIKKRIAVHHNSPMTFPIFARVIDKLLGDADYYTNIVTVAEHVKNDFSNYPSRYKKRYR